MDDKKQPIPVTGAWVRLRSRDRYGRVQGHDISPAGPRVRVQWFRPPGSGVVALSDLRNGFRLGMDVQDVPVSRVRRPLGEGEVVETRELGGRGQVLVEFPEVGQRHWMPYENLKQIKGIRHRFLLSESGSLERFRLRNLARALELWNENTGSLSRFDIDPLPHQIHVVHHIIASGNLNWMIADDVGLGKTIEVGMLLAALKQNGMFRRILLVTPAGLTRQWRDELRDRFSMDDFRIYGHDFVVNEPSHWKMYDHVIGSIDRFKIDAHQRMLLASGAWDLIIFDEAHRLSRRQWGLKFEESDRFRLAKKLRGMTDSMLLLTATPHQGMQDKFQALLELIRPEYSKEINRLSLHPEFLREMVIRNNKSTVTDVSGRLIFRGKTVHSIQVDPSEEVSRFDRMLVRYLKKGYDAAHRGGRQGVAIGFVMTVYRKLAASSAAAICQALERRLSRLKDGLESVSDLGDGEIDERYIGEFEEQESGSKVEFFHGEIRELEELIDAVSGLVTNDMKIRKLIDELVTVVLNANRSEKILVFTEYRATQDAIAKALSNHFGGSRVNVIRGGQTDQERLSEIRHFQGDGQFLVSTEAGGEGINLQERCHIMVNFDLPWNPMRLVQRIGRLYRYGQSHRVVVFNVHSRGTLDAKILELMYGRLTTVADELAGLGNEFNPGLADEILGQLADVMDVEKILEEAVSTRVNQTEAQIEEAIRNARSAVDKQRELFQYFVGFDPSEIQQELPIGVEHLEAFVEGMVVQLGIKVVNRTHGGKVLELAIPPGLADQLPERRTRLRVTVNRGFASRAAGAHILDLSSPLVQLFLEKAKAYAFGGQVAMLTDFDGDAVLTAVLRWQNDQGRRMRQEFAVASVGKDGRVQLNPEAFARWLLQPARDTGSPALEADQTRSSALLEAAGQALDIRLGQISNIDLHPENRQWVSGGRCVQPE